MPLYQAVKLASDAAEVGQPTQRAPRPRVLPVRRARQRRLRGQGQAAGDSADGRPALPAGRARQRALPRPRGTRRSRTSPASSRSGVTPADGQVLVVQQGTVVLQAANRTAGQHDHVLQPPGQFFVLRDNVALRGSDITNPQASTDSDRQPRLSQFGLQPRRRAAVPERDRQIAHRGQDVSTLGQSLNQHFAVALDNQLMTVPRSTTRSTPTESPAATGRSRRTHDQLRQTPRQRTTARRATGQPQAHQLDTDSHGPQPLSDQTKPRSAGTWARPGRTNLGETAGLSGLSCSATRWGFSPAAAQGRRCSKSPPSVRAIWTGAVIGCANATPTVRRCVGSGWLGVAYLRDCRTVVPETLRLMIATTCPGTVAS